MILLEDETIDPTEPFKPNNELPLRFSLWLHDENLRCEKAAREYAATMKRPKYLPLYEMTCAKIDEMERKLVDPKKVEVELTDEEYVYLLTRALIYGTSYRLSHLQKERPALAQKVFAQAMASYPDELKAVGARYQMLFNEMHENAKEIIQLKNYFWPDKVNSSIIFL